MPEAIRVQVSAGLGNQLFQLAAGLALVNRLGCPLILDRTWYVIQNYRPRRAFLLDQLSFQGDCMSADQPKPNISIERSFVLILAAQLTRNRPRSTALIESLLGLKILNETNPHCIDQRLHASSLGGNILLNGYWQTTDHFEAARSQLQGLQPAFELSHGFQHWNSLIYNSDSVFVHVRRGDFSKWPDSIMTPAFYRAAADSIRGAGFQNPKWFVFSEDHEWCRNHLQFLTGAEFVTFDSPNREIEEMFLMRGCRGGVIANSSFSWWAAALGDQPGRPVVASRYRHGRGKGDVQKERLLSNWITVDEF